MSGFEFLFSFYSLLLGLAVARVATGLADCWRTRGEVSLGASTLLMGLLVLLSAAEQWVSCWRGRDLLTMGPWQVLVCMGMSLPYIFISQAMLPHDHDKCADVDVHYLQNRRPLLLALLIPPAVSLAYNVCLQGIGIYAIWYILPFAIPIVLISSSRQWQHRVGLSLLAINVLVLMFA